MSAIDTIYKKPNETFDYLIKRGIKWWETLLLFSANGIVNLYYFMKVKGYLAIEPEKSYIPIVLTMIILGIIYGILSNFIFGFLIKVTGGIFSAKNNLKEIYTVLSWSFFPTSLSLVFLFMNLFIAYSIVEMEHSTYIIVFGLIALIFNLAFSVLEIWSFILMVKGIRKAQNLDTKYTILNILCAGVILGGLNYLLIYL